MFKVGDRVVRKGVSSIDIIPNGTEGTIVVITGRGYVDVDWDNGYKKYNSSPSYMQLISHAQPMANVKTMSAFKIKDRVRRIGIDVPGYVSIGDLGTVVELDIDPNAITSAVIVDYDNGSLRFRNAEDKLELVSRPLSVGDRVRRISAPTQAIPIGSLGKVESLFGTNTAGVLWDGLGSYEVDYDSLEVIDESLSSRTTANDLPAISNTIPSPPPQEEDILCKTKYYGINCNCPKKENHRHWWHDEKS